jgi:alkylation response protein AidB-like acyl-CoA dehydrogenase
VIEAAYDFDQAVWQRLVEDFSATSIHIPESAGGEGFGFAELCVLLTETGRELVPSPLWSSAALAACILLELVGDPVADELLAALAAGRSRATLAVVEPGGGWQPTSVGACLSRSSDGLRLSATKTLVPDAWADVLLVLSRPAKMQASGVVVAVARSDDVSVRIRRQASMDLTRPLYEVRFDGTPVRILGDPGGLEPARVTCALARATIALAAEMVGGARRCVERAVAYAGIREQFGRPIGSFQAIKHLCADMLVECELAEAAVRSAIDADGDDVVALASIAKMQASRAYLYCAFEGLHIHGGMGFTWEHDAHLYVRRAKACDLLLGDQRHHRQILARHLGLLPDDFKAGRAGGGA